MNKDVNRREQIIFKQDFDKNSGDKFNAEYKRLREAENKSNNPQEWWKKQSDLYNQYYVGGIRRFDHLSLDQLMQLIKEGFIDPFDHYNCSPTVDEFRKFVKGIKEYVAENPDFTSDDFDIYFIGYAVEPARPDYRVTIEGVVYHSQYKVDREIMMRFMKFAESADELDCNDTDGRAWWD